MEILNSVKSPSKFRQKYTVFAELGIALIAITLVAWMLGVQVEKTIKEDVRNSLSVVLDGTHKAISIWASQYLKTAERLSQSAEFRKHTESLLSVSNDRSTLLSSPELQHLRKDLEALIQSNQYKGYYIVSPDNINVASSRDINIAKPNLLISQNDVLDKLWSGESAMSRPLKSDVPLLMADGMMMDGHPTMFVGAPIKSQSGRVIAILLLRLDPFDGFIPLTQLGRLGRSGETYVFDENGLLVTESRFDEQLEKLGLLKEGEHSSLTLEVRDPGINFQKNKQKTSLNAELPLTRMAASATKGESGNDLAGYRDYRGVPVVGAWLWDNKLNMGLTVEQDVSEAYATLWVMQRIVYGSSGFAMLILIGLIWVSERGKKNLKRAEARLDSIFNNAVDSIVVIDEKGLIENVNPTVLVMFGYTRHELIGRNINILMPEPFKSQHDNYLSNYRETGERKIIGIGREVMAQRKNGQLFPIDLSVSEILVEGERQFAGIIHDISNRVAIEEKLKQTNDELRLMAMVAQNTDNAVIVANSEGQVIWVNEGFTTMCGYSLEEIAGRRPGDVLQGVDTDSSVVERIRGGLRQGQKVEEEILNYKKSGEAYWVHLEIIPIFDGQGELVEFISLEHDVTERRKMMHELQWAKATAESAVANHAKSERILLLSLAAAGTGYWFINFGSGVLKLDKRSMEIFGISGMDFSGRYQDWANWVHPDDFPMAQGEFIDALDDPETTNFTLDYRIVWPNGEVRYVNVSANIERNEVGMPISAYGLYFDDTDRIHEKEVVQEARVEAEAANLAKSSFLAAMSHEIRTPMNGVVGMIDVLRQTELSREQRNMVHTIRDSSFSLLSIIDDILDFSKIEAGKLSLECLPTSIEEMLEGVGDTLLPMAFNKGIELLLYYSPVIPPLVYADPVRLRQILFNLAGNAIKFTDSDSGDIGRVQMRADLDTMPDGRACLLLKIEDNGIGMAPEVQAQLFQPFVQAESSTTRRFGGTGLGLTICRRLADLMGGYIEMESVKGEGSTFTVKIPLEVASIEPIQDMIDLEGVNVLLVNSEETIDIIIDIYLSVAGANVVRMNVGGNVVEAIEDLSPTACELVVIIDGHIKPGQGPSLRQQLSEELAIFKPVFVTLQHGRRQSPRKNDEGSVSIDIDAMHRSAFLHAVEGALGRIFVKSKPTFDENVEGNVIVQTALSVSDAKATGRLILLVEDNKTNQKVLLCQIGLLGFAAEVANDGCEALSMWRNGHYACVLTDLQMPEMDGFELTQSIRDEEIEGSHVPIIAISANALKETKQECLASGMDDYLTKPVQLDVLRDKLTQWFGDDVSESKSNSKITLEASDKDKVSAVDPNVLKEILGVDDPVMLADFYADFIRGSEEIVSALLAAQKNHDAEEVGALGHRMKSSARTVGANTLADCCLALELAGKEADWKAIDPQIDQLPAYLQAVKDWLLQQNS
jgi:two-component system sensor histidine kinase/response regulator